jgi:uncharacterized protein YcbX
MDTPITPIVVTALAITAVKGTNLRSVDRIRLDRDGVRENRRFYLIDARDRLVNGKVLGELTAIVADYSDTARRLTLTLPDGSVCEDGIRLGEPVATRFFSGVVVGRLVHGPLSERLSEFAGQPIRLVEAPDVGGAVDRRGRGGHVSLMSRASLARLREAGDAAEVDGRRFRMLIEVDGVPAHAEDDWVDRSVQIGEALVAFGGHIGRCLITSRDPDTGEIDLPTLDMLRSYRGDLGTTEPLAFGIYGHALVPGTIRVGDPVTPGDTIRGPSAPADQAPARQLRRMNASASGPAADNAPAREPAGAAASEPAGAAAREPAGAAAARAGGSGSPRAGGSGSP